MDTLESLTFHFAPLEYMKYVVLQPSLLLVVSLRHLFCVVHNVTEAELPELDALTLTSTL